MVRVVALVDVVALVLAVVAVVQELVEGLALEELVQELVQVLQDNLRYHCTCGSNQCCTSPQSHDSCHMTLHRPTWTNSILARPVR